LEEILISNQKSGETFEAINYNIYRDLEVSDISETLDFHQKGYLNQLFEANNRVIVQSSSRTFQQLY
jgi:hypothetical protein